MADRRVELKTDSADGQRITVVEYQIEAVEPTRLRRFKQACDKLFGWEPTKVTDKIFEYIDIYIETGVALKIHEHLLFLIGPRQGRLREVTETPDIEGAVTEVAKDLGLNVGPKDDRWDPIENPRSLDEFEVARLEYLAALLLYNDRQQEYALDDKGLQEAYRRLTASEYKLRTFGTDQAVYYLNIAQIAWLRQWRRNIGLGAVRSIGETLRNSRSVA